MWRYPFSGWVPSTRPSERRYVLSSGGFGLAVLHFLGLSKMADFQESATHKARRHNVLAVESKVRRFAANQIELNDLKTYKLKSYHAIKWERIIFQAL